MNLIDCVGRRWGMLVGIRRVGSAGKKPLWLWRCDCGRNVEYTYNHVGYGRAVSCGCSEPHIIHHGYSHSRTYNAWIGMKARVDGITAKGAKDYRDRGIMICDQWRDNFLNFLADMGECPPGLSIDRKNNDGNYEPGNCRWATTSQQSRNRRSNVIVTYQGKPLCLKEACEKAAISYNSVLTRRRRGMKTQEAFERGLR